MSTTASARRRVARDGALRHTALTLALVLAGAAVSWWRLGPTTRGTLWAEDGQVFLLERLDLGVAGSLLHPYAGYLHLWPRLLTDVAFALAPVERYAVAMSALCCLSVGAVAAGVYWCSAGVLDSRWTRLAMAAVTVLVPAAPIEVLGNAANVHSYFLWLAPWLLLARPTRHWHAVALALAAGAAALTEIQCALFLPLALVGLRDRRRWPMLVAFAAGLAAQVTATVLQPRADVDNPGPGPLDLVKAHLVHVVLPVWHPSKQGAGSLLAEHGWSVAVAAAVPFLAAGLLALVVLTRRALRREERSLAPLLVLAALAAGAVVPLVAAFLLNPPLVPLGTMSAADFAQTRPLRYGVAPAMFLLAIPVYAADLLLRATSPWPRRTGLALVAATLVLALVHVAPDGTRRSTGPLWAKEVAASRQACEDGRTRPVRAAPQAQWAVPLSCELLAADR